MSHPSVCPKCKYNRPLALNYCPHCRDLSPKEKENARKEINNKFESIVKSAKQEKQQATSVKKTDKLKKVQRTRNNTNRKAKSRTKSSKTKRKIKSRV